MKRALIGSLALAGVLAACEAPSTIETVTAPSAPSTVVDPVTPTRAADPVTPSSVVVDPVAPTVPDPVTPSSVVVVPVAPTVPDPVTSTGLVFGKDATVPDPTWSKPAVGESYIDAAYGTTVRRMTSADGTRFNRNTYSRRQAENADGSLIFTYHGTAAYHVYDRETTDLVRALDIHPDAEPQWHRTDPNVIRYVAGPNSSTGELRLHEINVRTGQSTVIADLTSRLQAALPGALYIKDRAEGSPSADGNRYAWMVYDAAENVVGLVAYDLATDEILGVSGQLRAAGDALDWVGISPSGNHVLAGYHDGTYSYDMTFTNAQLVSPTEHSDIAINAARNDTYVFIDFSAGPDGGWLMAVDLETMERTRIFDLYDQANTSIHISGKGSNRPGWVVVSTYNCKVPGAWSCDKVMAVELQPNGKIVNLAHTHNCGENYWTETQAVVNRDFSRVYFNTDAGSCGIDAEVMEIQVPKF